MVPVEFRALIGQILIRPRLWPLVLSAAWRFRRREWYRYAPFLPLPSRDYWEWRTHTAFGSERTTPTLEELVSFLEWTARMHHD